MKIYFLIFITFISLSCSNIINSKKEIGNIEIQAINLDDSGNLHLRLKGKLIDSALLISSYKIIYEGDKIILEINRNIVGKDNGYSGPYDIQFYVPRNIKQVVFVDGEILWSR